MSIKKIFPFIIFLGLVVILGRELFYAKPNELPSALLGQNVPAFEVPTLLGQTKLTEKDLKGRVTLLNVWATWCYACSQEHEMLMKIKNQYRIPVYSLDYKDNPSDAKKWLRQLGNPYVLTGIDAKGDVAIDLGIYGTPETFVINKEGKIVYRHVGVITQQVWDEVLYPVVKKYA